MEGGGLDAPEPVCRGTRREWVMGDHPGPALAGIRAIVWLQA